MRSGRDGDQLGDRVNSVAAATGENRRETSLPRLRAEVAAIEPDMRSPGLHHAALDSTRDDVSRRKFGQRMHANHEPLAVEIAQESALAPNRFGHEGLLTARLRSEPQDGGVELHKLQICDLGTGPQCQGDPIPGRDSRVRRLGKDLPETTGRQDHNGRERSTDTIAGALPHDMQ